MSDYGASSALYFGPWYRRGPYFESSLRAGCKAHDIYNHMYLPGYYGDPIEEYWHLMEHVTLWDVAAERIVEISGPDAFAFTNMLTCRNLETCAVGQCKYAPLLAEDGGIVNDPVLLRLADDVFWLSLADSDAGLWARGVAVNARMDVRITEPEVYPLQVQGPKAKDVMGALLDGPTVDLRYYWCAEADIDGIPVVVSRTGWTGEVGYEVYLRDPGRGGDLWDRIMEAGKPQQIRPIAPCEARRVEAGIFNYGSDMTLEHNPLEISGMERLVEEQEAGYIGKESLARVAAEGVSRKLVGLEIPGEPIPFELAEHRPAFHDGEEVGSVTELIWSPRLERNIGYVWVPVELSEPGTVVQVGLPDGSRREARTASLPFIDPRKQIPAA